MSGGGLDRMRGRVYEADPRFDVGREIEESPSEGNKAGCKFAKQQHSIWLFSFLQS